MSASSLDFRFVKKKVLHDKVVFIDGMGISGTHMLAPILSTYQGVEISRADAIFEHIANLHYFGRMNLEGAATLMRYALDEDLYDSMIGRNTNFRPTDASSVFHAANHQRYLSRLLSEDEGEIIVKRIRREKPVFQNLTREILGFVEPCFAAFGRGLRILEMVRHPVSLLERWLNSGWGDNRYKADPRSFVLSVERGGHVGAYFSRDCLERYSAMSPTARVIHDIHSVWTRIEDSYRSLPKARKDQVLFLKFEDFVTRPHQELERISKFVGIKPGPRLHEALAEQRCPRKLSLSDQHGHWKLIAKRTNRESRALLEELIEKYERLDARSPKI